MQQGETFYERFLLHRQAEHVRMIRQLKRSVWCWRLAFIVAAGMAASALVAQEPPHVEIDNPSNLAVRVWDPITMRAIRVYPGMEAMLPLTGYYPRRVLMVDTGERVFRTLDFTVGPATPCYRLTLQLQGWREPRLEFCQEFGRR